MSTFINGLDLSKSFFYEIAQPILKESYPSLRYSAGLIGYGSDVLGFDDEMSTDHMWGPRFHLFLPPTDFELTKDHISKLFTSEFPYKFRGYSVNFSPPDVEDGGVRVPREINAGAVDPLIEYYTPASFFKEYLGWDIEQEVSPVQWLTFPEHRLLGVTSGSVFHDGLGITELRQQLTYYPRDVWLWMMASQWKMIAEEEPFTGRCGFAGDELGSRIVAARQVQRLIRLAFLMEQRYTPYSKWLGKAFKQLEIAPLLAPLLHQVLEANNWKSRGKNLSKAYSLLAEEHNTLDLTKPMETATTHFFDRPFDVIHGNRFSQALLDGINDPVLRSLPPIGTLNQITDSVTVYDDLSLTEKFGRFYRT